jgi:hypothetical protein
MPELIILELSINITGPNEENACNINRKKVNMKLMNTGMP